ncbi:unnamed protein product [Cunninghamella blakesleeana]
MQEGEIISDDSLYPFFTIIHITSITKDNKLNPLICGGSIINLNPPIVITAAHCLMNSPHPSTFIKNTQKNPHYAGYGHTDKKQHIINPIIDWQTHPKYNTTIKDPKYDVAIIYLKDPIVRSNYADRVPIWTSDKYHQLQGALVGYGYEELNGKPSTTLKRLTFDVNDYNPNSNKLVDAVATFGIDKRTSCHGDSGGGLIVQLPYSASQQNQPALEYYIIGPLTRIYNVKDPDPIHLTCPVRSNESKDVVQSFVNLATLMDWILPVTNMTMEQITTPENNYSLIDVNGHQQNPFGTNSSSKSTFIYPSSINLQLFLFLLHLILNLL